MKPKPSGYKTAIESRKPGYLKDRFEQIRRRQQADAEQKQKTDGEQKVIGRIPERKLSR